MFIWTRSLTLSIFFSVVLAEKCAEKWHRIHAAGSSAKCIRYFDNPVNFSEAQYVCNEIYDGDLISISSALEQKLLVQYLHSEVGFKRQPVNWIGATLTLQNVPPTVHYTAEQQAEMLSQKVKWIDGTVAKFHNFGFNPVLNPAGNGERKCVKILSLIAKGDQGTPGMWSADNCNLRDSGFVCQKLPDKHENSIDRSRISDSVSDFDTLLESPKSNYLFRQFGEQLKAIKELCDAQIKAIEQLTTNFLYVLQNAEAKKRKEEL